MSIYNTKGEFNTINVREDDEYIDLSVVNEEGKVHEYLCLPKAYEKHREIIRTELSRIILQYHIQACIAQCNVL